MSKLIKTPRMSASFEAVYHQSRRLAICLALASARDEAAAYAHSAKAHAWVLALPERKAKDVPRILSRLYQKLPSRVPASRHFPQLEQLDKAERSVFALSQAGGLEDEQVQAILRLDAARFLQAKQKAAKVMDQQATQAFVLEADRLLMRKEIWSDILFLAGKRRSTGRRLRVALLTALAACLLVVLGRETVALVSVLGSSPPDGSQVLADRYQDAGYYRRRLEVMSVTQPRLSGSLQDSLQQVGEEQPVRVAFRFYDRQVMLGLKEGGLNLEESYIALYQQSLTQGQVNTLVANAVVKYFENYQRPFQVKQRSEDFKSKFDSIHQAALYLARGSGFAKTVDSHPQIFGSAEQFDAYLYSRLFISQAPQAFPLLRAHYLFEEAAKSGQPVTAEQRTAYEDALFAFTNPGGLNGRIQVLPFAFLPGQTAAFYVVRERLGKALYQANVDRCTQVLGPQAQVRSDILEGSESSLFSATLTKGQILRLARTDSRFEFLGLSAVPGPVPSTRMEAELYLKAREGLLTKHQVFRIDEVFLLYSINYAAPLALPAGFIRDLRAAIDCRDTQFEMEIQYNYHMRYAHPQERLGYSLLRDMRLHPGLAYTTDQFKYFYKMSRD